MHTKEANVLPQSDYYLYLPSTIASKVYLYPIAIGYFYYAPGYSLRRNSYDSFLLMHVRHGSLNLKTCGKTYHLRQDCFVLIDCYQPHEYSNAGSDILELSWIHFDGVLARNFYDLITGGTDHVFTTGNIHSIVQNMDKLLTMFRTSAPIKEASVSRYITHILTDFLNSHVDLSSESSSRNLVIENSLSYINEHFNEPLSLDTLAQNANLSPYYFSRLFSRETGFTPHQYLLATRINSAKFLLQNPQLSIKEIAFQCGFNNESSFCSTFRKREQITPGEYRTRILQ